MASAPGAPPNSRRSPDAREPASVGPDEAPGGGVERGSSWEPPSRWGGVTGAKGGGSGGVRAFEPGGGRLLRARNARMDARVEVADVWSRRDAPVAVRASPGGAPRPSRGPRTRGLSVCSRERNETRAVSKCVKVKIKKHLRDDRARVAAAPGTSITRRRRRPFASRSVQPFPPPSAERASSARGTPPSWSRSTC